MHLLVGLGNPQSRFAATRHNVGFEVLSLLAERHRFSSAEAVGSARVRKGVIAGVRASLVWPTTPMNLSGGAVREVLQASAADSPEVVVIHDEIAFEPGTVRIKRGGGHGGHGGLRSIIDEIGPDFARVRLGIGRPPKVPTALSLVRRLVAVYWVLAKFRAGERATMDRAIERAAEAAEVLVREGVERAMNVINAQVGPAG